MKRKNAELERTVEILKAATSFFARASDATVTTGVICGFVGEHRARFGSLRSGTRALLAHGCQIAPRTHYAWARRAPSKRALWDTTVTELLAGYYGPDGADGHGRPKPGSLYGSFKMWVYCGGSVCRSRGAPWSG